MQIRDTEIAGVMLANHSLGKRLAPSVHSDSDRWQERHFLAQHGATLPLTLLDHEDGERAVRCLEGSIAAVVVDCRPESDSFGDSITFDFHADASTTLIVPVGVAIGWQATGEYASVAQAEFSHASDSVLIIDDSTVAPEWPIEISAVLPVLVGEFPAESVDLDWLESRAAKCSFETPVDHAAAIPAIAPLTKGVLSARIRSSEDPTILIIGSTGQLGHDLCRRLRGIGRVIGACRKPRSGGQLPIATSIDVSRPASIREAIRRTRPQLIINATGLTDLAACEASPRRAQGINATGPAIMAEEAAKVGAGIMHFCSDKVFAGQGEKPFSESDTPQPINQYGLTKLRGTQAVLGGSASNMVIRTGWLYSTHGTNYVQNIVDLITYRASLKIATDYFGTPTSTDWLAQVVADLLTRADGDFSSWLQNFGGLYHAAMLGYASRIDVADHVVATCRQHALPVVLQKLNGVSIDEFSGTANCPKNCRLDASRLATHFQLTLPSWREELSRQLAIMLGVNEGRLLSIA